MNKAILYHATTRDLLPLIMQHGLDPQQSQHVNDEIDYPAPHHFVYLDDRMHIAQRFGPGGELHYNANRDDAVLLQITLPEHLQRQLITCRGEFIRAPFVIEPRYIKAL